MLANAQIVEVVARKIREYGVKKVVVDPVMVAKSGDSLLRKDAQDALIKKLIPLPWWSRPIFQRLRFSLDSR